MYIYASYNWIKEYLNTKDNPEELAKKITLSGSGVENIIDEAKVFEGMVVGKVIELKDHPNADKLKLAITDIGRKKVEIVCGGVNLTEGMLVPVALPGSKVRWHGQEEWTELAETEVRGVKSFGMICAPEELGLDKLQVGAKDIWDITELTSAKPGTPLAEALGFNDHILYTEITTNRPDAMSIIGLAREGHVVTGDLFEIKSSAASPVAEKKLELKVEVNEKGLCPRYQALVIDGVKVGPSPWWLQKRLLAAGHRPINNIVDITNYVLHEYGQPLHAFDYEKLQGSKIVVRKAKKGEKLQALDENEYELGPDNLVIADAKVPVAVAGVMGGEPTGVTGETKTIVFECANFDPVSVRRTSRALNLQSDSQQLFEKGLSGESTKAALMRAVELTLDLAGGEVAGSTIDVRQGSYQPLKFGFDPKQAEKRIGVKVGEDKMINILESLGFETDRKDDGTYEVEVPHWRDQDIEDSVDFVEEIARVYGYQNIPSLMPEGEIPKRVMSKDLVWERKVKQIMRAAGATEVFSHSMLATEDFERYGLSSDDAVRIANPLTQDHEFMRTSLVPGLLNSIETNQCEAQDAHLFELSRVYLPNKKDLPTEPLRLLIAAYSPDGAKAFYDAKGLLERLMCDGAVRDWSLERGVEDERWHQGRSAKVLVGGEVIGVIGEVSREVAKKFGLDYRVTLVEIDFEKLLPYLTDSKCYVPPSEFPSVKRDLSFLVESGVEYEKIRESILGIDPLLESVELFDVYEGKGVPAGQKSVAVHMRFQSSERTLCSEEVEKVVEAIIGMLESDFSATIRA